MACDKYLLKNGDETYEFNSKEELGSFLINNKHRVNGLKYDSSIKFSKQPDQQSETYAQLLKLKDFTLKEDYTEYGEKVQTLKDYISVTKAITLGDLFEDGKPLVTGFNEEDYFNKLVDSLKEKINPDTNKFYNDSEIEDYIKNLKTRWGQLAKMGTAIHKISEIFFGNTSLNKEDVYNIFKNSREAKDVSFNTEDYDHMFNYVKNIHKQLLNRYPDAMFIPEMKLRTKSPGGPNFVGKVDLMIITKTGDVHVFDFKTSPTKYDDYSQIKQLTFDYQLAFYRQMLNQAGINVRNTELGILPIELMNVDYENNTVKTINESPIIDMRTSSEGGSAYKRNSYQKLQQGAGYVALNVERLIPSKELAFSLNTDISENFDKLNKELFGYDAENSSGVRSKKTLDELKANVRKDNSGKYVVKDDFTGVYEKFDKIEKAHEAIENNYKKNQNKKLFYAQDVANNYNTAANSNAKAFNFKNDGNKSNNYNKLYGQYLKEGYKLNDSLLPHGILVFYHESYKTIDFIYINNEDLSKELKDLTYGKNGVKITGNLTHDKNVPKYTLDANVGNIELMRLMIAVNEFMPTISDEYQVKDLKVINNFNYKIAYQNIDLLKENFKILIRYAHEKKPDLQIENNFTKKVNDRVLIQSVDPVQRVMNQIDSILADDTDNRYEFLSGVKTKLYQAKDKTQETRLDKLIELSKEISSNTMGYTGRILDPLTDLDNPLSQIYYVIHDAIREEKKLLFEYQFADIEKMSPQSELLTPAQQSKIKVTQEVQAKIIQTAKDRMIKRLNEDLTDSKVASENYLKSTGSIDSSLNAFDGLIERFENGNSVIFRVKNPKTTPLAQHEKDFLNTWLKTINKIRYPETNGDMDSLEAMEHVESGAWFDIPLESGGLVNKGMKGVRQWFSDVKENIKNPMMVIEKAQQHQYNQQIDRFETYINPMKVEGTDRDNFIIEKGINYFSRDLATIMLDYQYHNILEDEYNQVLPYVRTAIICSNAVNIFTKAELNDAMKIMYEKFQTEVFKINHISKGAMPYYQGYMIMSNLANMFTLVGNPVSFVRELMTGRYNNYGRVLTRFGGKDAPNAADLTKAYLFVDAKGAEAAFSQNIMNAFNMRFNIGGRAIHEMKESHRSQRNTLFGMMFRSGACYTMNQIPDYEHRMALFIAYMYKEGCMEAYEYDNKNQKLIYNFDKDPRFKHVKEFAKTGKAPSDQMENIAKYRMMLEEHNSLVPDDQKLKFGDPLPEGISNSRIATIKNISNQIHGNLDSETSAHIQRYFYGKIFTKFQTFLSAKILNYTLKPGKYQLMEENYAKDPETGKQLYLKRTLNPTTGEYEMTTTTDLDDPDCTKQPVIEMQERQEAGTLYALREIFDILSNPENRSEKWMEFQQDDAKLAGLKFMLGDLLMLLLTSIFGSMAALPELRKTDPLTADAINAMFINPSKENNPIILLSNALKVIDSPTVAINKKAFSNTVNYLTNEDFKTKEYFYKFGFGKYSGFF